MASTIPDNEIQRVLFVAPKAHVYKVPPLQSNQGYKASQWNVDSERSRIFTARIRIIETASPDPKNPDEESVRTDVRLEDPRTGDLFANCPYEGAFCVEQVLDSSRFFAIRAADGPRRAILGIGFEERSEAFDFNVSLQEVRQHNGMDNAASGGKKEAPAITHQAEKKDYSLKEGETISISIGNKGRRKSTSEAKSTGDAPLPFLPPPPSADQVKAHNRKASQSAAEKLGFDDDFGDFV